MRVRDTEIYSDGQRLYLFFEDGTGFRFRTFEVTNLKVKSLEPETVEITGSPFQTFKSQMYLDNGGVEIEIEIFSKEGETIYFDQKRVLAGIRRLLDSIGTIQESKSKT